MSRHFGYKKYSVNMILCACGCGQLIADRDKKCRLRKCVRGHKTPDQVEQSRLRMLGKISPMKGKQYSDEVRRNMSLAHIGKELPLATRLNMSKAQKGKWLGRPLTEETKAKIREKRKLQTFSDETRAKLSAEKFVRWRNPEYKARLSAKFREYWAIPENKEKRVEIIRRTIARGENAGGWCGGISFEPYTKEFNKKLKSEIRDRDGHLCQLCGKTELENGKSLTVHHVDYDKTNSADDNLISLCVGCNSKVNTNREFWTEYFSQLLQYVVTVSDQPLSVLVAV